MNATTLTDGIRYGAKYSQDRSLVDIAKAIRADLKDAVSCGNLPKGKYSVRIDRFSMGCSVGVHVKDVAGLQVHNPSRLVADRDEPHAFCRLPVLTVEAQALVSKLEELVGAYNYDGSRIEEDYVSVRFYAHVGFDHDWQRARRGAELAALAPTLPPSAPANDVSDEEDARHEARNASERAEMVRDERLDSCPAAAWHDPGQGCCLCDA